jgi:hypothetical protein
VLDAVAIACPSVDRVVNSHELATVRKGRLDLNVDEHLWHAWQHLVAGQNASAGGHEVGDAAALACPLEHPGRDQSDRLGVVEVDATGEPVASDHTRDCEKELLCFCRREMHAAPFEFAARSLTLVR